MTVSTARVVAIVWPGGEYDVRVEATRREDEERLIPAARYLMASLGAMEELLDISTRKNVVNL